MGPLWIVLLAVAGAAALVWRSRRRAAQQRELCRQRLSALLERRRPELSLVEAERGGWQLRCEAEAPVAVDAGKLTRATAGDEESRRRIFLALADAALAGPRPLTGDFDLKLHGARVLPRLADEGLPLLALEPGAVRFIGTASAGLPTIYVVDGEPQGAYLTDDHLDRAGLDARDLHGVALAVLRQRFDEALVRATLDGREAVAIEPEDGCGGSWLLLLPESLIEGEELFAAAPSPAVLLVAAERGMLEEALAGRHDPAHPLPPAVFRVTAGGLDEES